MTVYRPECRICRHAVIKDGIFIGGDNRKCNMERKDNGK